MRIEPEAAVTPALARGRAPACPGREAPEIGPSKQELTLEALGAGRTLNFPAEVDPATTRHGRSQLLELKPAALVLERQNETRYEVAREVRLID